MSATIPDNYLDLFTTNVVVSLATLNKDGSPQVHPVWCGFSDGLVLVNSAKGRAKDRNMRGNAKATVLATDPKNPYRWCEVRGDIVEITETGADDAIEEFSHRYLGKPYPFRSPSEVRVLYKIKPTVVHAMG